MNFLNCISNFPWRRFGTVYETNSAGLKEKFIKIQNGEAQASDYQYIIDRLEHQETLYPITPWGLKFYIHLLDEEKVDKAILLKDIKVLFEAANYNNQVNLATNYKPTKGNLAKYEKIKEKLFDDEFDGTMDDDFLKTIKSIDRKFMQICIMEYISYKKQLLEKFTDSKDSMVANNAKSLIDSINNPRQYKFGS